MKLTCSLIALTCFSFPVWAEESHDHDHEHEEHGDEAHEDEADFDVEAYQLTLKGEQGFGEACYLGVVEQGTTAEGNFFAWLETSFQHENEGPGRLYATLDSANPSRLTALTESGSRISVELNPGFTSLKEAFRYAVSWLHEGHTDTGFCSNLTLVHEAGAE